MDLIFDETKRTLAPSDESFTWLVHTKISLNGKPRNFWNYTWDDLYQLYAIGHHQTGKYGSFQKIEVRNRLKAYLKTIL